MDASVGITLSLHDLKTLKELATDGVSAKIREILADIDVEELREHLETDRVTCRLDLETALKLQKAAAQLKVDPARVARALTEKYLHKT